MKTHTFKGGIYPPEKKELSADKPITAVFPVSNTVTIPVTMGGAPNTPLVKVGDVVKKGQVIAKSDAFMSAPVHASISGKVKKIQTNLVTGGSFAPCIIIEGNGSEETDFLPPLDILSCSKEEALARVREAGIVGMGGASFPTHIKLNPPSDKKISYVLLNAAECEPYLTVDERTLLEDAQKVIDGLSIVCQILEKSAENEKSNQIKGIIALETNKAHTAPLLQEEIKKASLENKISIAFVKTKYPQGCEKNIVDAILNVEIPAGKLPADSGAVICNVGTVCAISDAFRLGKPLIERAFTVSGGACETPCNLRVPVGTLLSDLSGNAFKLKDGEVAKIISGGPMMGFSMESENFPIAKGTSGITFLTKKETYLTQEDPCINCGRCVKACPMRLTPVLMIRSLKADELDSAKKFGLMDCIECGSCAYVCPANVRLVQRIRLGKLSVREALQAKKSQGGAK